MNQSIFLKYWFIPFTLQSHLPDLSIPSIPFLIRSYSLDDNLLSLFLLLRPSNQPLSTVLSIYLHISYPHTASPTACHGFLNSSCKYPDPMHQPYPAHNTVIISHITQYLHNTRFLTVTNSVKTRIAPRLPYQHHANILVKCSHYNTPYLPYPYPLTVLLISEGCDRDDGRPDSLLPRDGHCGDRCQRQLWGTVTYRIPVNSNLPYPILQ